MSNPDTSAGLYKCDTKSCKNEVVHSEGERNEKNLNFWPHRQGKASPIWVASHSPISKYDQDRTIKLFQKYEEYGVSLLVTGEIILDCFDDDMGGPV